MANKKRPTKKKWSAALREAAMDYPETIEDFPWGSSVFKVNKKIFFSLADDEDGVRMSFKLPESRYEALTLPFTEPTHYGMGKHGWVTAKFAPGDTPPVDLLLEWMDESFRAIAPKRAIKLLDQPG